MDGKWVTVPVRRGKGHRGGGAGASTGVGPSTAAIAPAEPPSAAAVAASRKRVERMLRATAPGAGAAAGFFAELAGRVVAHLAATVAAGGDGPRPAPAPQGTAAPLPAPPTPRAPPPKEIALLAFGIGPVVGDAASETQLAFFLALRDHLAVRLAAPPSPSAPPGDSPSDGVAGWSLRPAFFDPVAPPPELLAAFALPALPGNTFGALPATPWWRDGADTAATAACPGGGRDGWPVGAAVVFMPRCPRVLYHNFFLSVAPPPLPHTPASLAAPGRFLPFVLLGNDCEAYLDTTVAGSRASAVEVLLPALRTAPVAADPAAGCGAPPRKKRRNGGGGGGDALDRWIAAAGVGSAAAVQDVAWVALPDAAAAAHTWHTRVWRYGQPVVVRTGADVV